MNKEHVKGTDEKTKGKINKIVGRATGDLDQEL